MTKDKKSTPTTKASTRAGSRKSASRQNAVQEEAASLPPPAGVSRHTIPLALDERAGLMLLKHPRFKQTQLRFTSKPPKSITHQLLRLGWTWRHLEGVYTRQFGSQGETASVDESRKLFEELCVALRQPADELAE